MQLVDLHTFKTRKCDQTHNPLLGPHFFNCPYSHNKLDRRRNPFSENKHEVTYSEIYVEDFYSI